MVGALSGDPQHILLAGGGHAHAVALRRLAKQPLPAGIRLTLVSPSTHNLYSGALPGVIAGHWKADSIGVPLRPLCDAAKVQFVQDRLVSIEPDARTARLESGKQVSFDLASLDIGSGIRPLDVPDALDVIVPIRPIGPFLDRWQKTLAEIKAGSAPPSIIVVGAGLAGIEVALAIHYRLQQEGIAAPSIHLVDAGSDIAGSSSPALRRKLARAMRRAKINLILQTRIQTIQDGSVLLSSGESLETSLVVNCAGSAPHGWIGQSGLNTVEGRVEVDACLRSTSHPHIWAAGDTSYFKPKPLEPAGVFAVRAGPVIAENIGRYAQNAGLSEFHPQSDCLKLISLGDQRAVAEKFGFALEAGWLWHLKKKIDFSFLREHNLTPGH
tara:strand:+ start:27388 stop:28536 length:1149 start_codon:yes stop_codon:yes gene_type:complete